MSDENQNQTETEVATEVATEAVDSKPRAGAALTKYQKQYGKAGNCGDSVAEAMSYCTVEGKASPERIAEVAGANGIDMTKYAALNIGMQRMNLGNRLRGLHNAGKEVTIGTTVIAGAEKGGAKLGGQKSAAEAA
jgi:hypothetical protein